MLTGQNYIAGKLSSKGSKTFYTFNPIANSQNSQLYTEASQEEINLAVDLASKAFVEYRKIDGKTKANFLRTIADEIVALGEDLVSVYCSETGLPEGRAKGERGRTVFQLQSFADLIEEGSWVDASIDTANPDREPAPKPDLRKMNIPLGPVVVFGASNFPLAYSTAGGDTAAALAAGCPVIVKSHPMHAGTGELVAKAISIAVKKCNIPAGVFSNLNSSGIDIGVQLVSHPKVKAVGFTGSIKGGRALLDLAAKREEPIPVFAEMGSVNPVVLLSEALKENNENLAVTYANSITLGTGQFCTNPGLILGLKSEDLSVFIERLGKEITSKEPSVMLHPNIVGAYENKKQKVINEDGVSVVSEYNHDTNPNYARQIITTVEGSTFLNKPTLHQEVFGPYSIVVQCENIEQLEEIILQLEGQLTGTLIATNKEAKKFPKIISAMQNRVGRIIFNGVPTGVEVCPSMVHGGPYPASTDSRFTAVGVSSIKRWVRPFSYQDWPNDLLPNELKDENPLGISRVVNGVTISR